MSDEYDPTKDPEFADPHRRTPRAYTTEEVRELFLEAVGALINYWKNNRDDPINDPIGRLDGRTATRTRDRCCS